MLRKSPGFTALALLTLALGIGANTAIFSVVSAVLIRGLPFPNAGRLAALFQSPKGMKGPIGWAASGPDIADWQRDSRSFSVIAASLEDGANFNDSGAPQYLLGEKVTPNFLPCWERAIDPQIPLSDAKTGHQVIQSWAGDLPYQAVLPASFALMALLIAVIGVFGAMAYTTARRTHEIGIRMALGAQQSQVLPTVIREGMLLVGVGIAIGIGSAPALTRFSRSLLFEIKPSDPPTFFGMAILLIVVSLLAISPRAARCA
jgi:FtsX-like permease family